MQLDYIPCDYANDIDDDYFIYKNHGKALLYKPPALNCPLRDDVQPWQDSFSAELHSNLKIGADAPTDIHTTIISIIKDNWDAFFATGARRPILGFEFCLDTGAAKPVCCRQPNYGHHESKIIQAQINAYKANHLIRKCEGPWASSIVLAPEPHQEHITSINKFVWHMCVSYRMLSTKTLPFEYPIPRCIDAIENLGDSNGCLYFISLDTHQGFHQIAVHLANQDKLAFFGPDAKKYTFVVMPFGPRNGPPTYTAMMRRLKDEWSTLTSPGPPPHPWQQFHHQ